ncbi:MAG TPA: hypothetical protein VFA35_09820, partial [Burkholderiaceae bacterium]|nr:hypothetical protein [Burkholderiaceae bacterium]
GWNEEFGNGCPGSAGVPDMRAQTEPTVGRTFIFQLANCAPATLLRLVVVGLSNTVAGGSPLPAPLGSLGMPGCSLLVSINFNPSCGQDGYGVIRIPNAAMYDGMGFFMQGFAIEPGVNPGGMISSNGLHCVVGM